MIVCKTAAKMIAFIALLFISGCAEMPIKDGALTIGKNTTATMDDLGVGRVDNKF